MPPNTFWETEPADTIAFINAQAEERYNMSVGLAQNIIASLSNAMSKHPKDSIFPPYDELLMQRIKEELKKQMTQEERLNMRAAELRARFAGKFNTQ